MTADSDYLVVEQGSLVPANPEQTDQSGCRESLYHAAAAEFGAAIARLAAAYEANLAERADLVQDIHFQLWRSLALFDGRCSLRTWVYRVAHNVAAGHATNAARRRGRIATTSLEELAVRDGAPAPDARADNAPTLERLHAMIEELAATDRQVILLYLEEIEADEIGEITGLSAGAVATRISRIKALLSRRFGEGKS